MSKPTFGGLVRSNFWKGRQRLNRLYRWIANVVRPKIDGDILLEAGFQNNPGMRDFLAPRAATRPPAQRQIAVMRGRRARFRGSPGPGLAAAELAAAGRCATRRSVRLLPVAWWSTNITT